MRMFIGKCFYTWIVCNVSRDKLSEKFILWELKKISIPLFSKEGLGEILMELF